MRAHEGPVLVCFNTPHEEIWDPQGVEEVTGSVLFRSIVLAQLQEIVHVRVPWLKVDGKCTFTLAASLIDISRGVVEHFEHGHQAVRVPIGSSDIRLRSPDTVHSEADSSCVFGNDSGLLQGVIDALDGIFTHGQEETRGHLRLLGPRVEKRWCGMREPLLAHQIVGLEGGIKITEVNPYRASHEQVLGSLSYLAIDAE